MNSQVQIPVLEQICVIEMYTRVKQRKAYLFKLQLELGTVHVAASINSQRIKYLTFTESLVNWGIASVV